MERKTGLVGELRHGILSVADALAQSVALLSLALGVAFASSAAAGETGIAAPFAYLIAGIGSLCLGSVIIRFTRRMASAGGLYTYIARGINPSAGFLGGWLYGSAFAVGISFVLVIGSFFMSVAMSAHTGIHWGWFPWFFVFLGGLALLAFLDMFLAVVLTFTGFIGFEAAAVLGEEAADPLRAIPRAILAAVLVALVYYVFVTWAMGVGFGVSNADKWAKDPAALDTLATRYVGNWLAVIIDFAVAASGFVAALGGLHLTSRTLYAMGREGGLPRVFAWTHPRFRTPWTCIAFSLVVTLLLGTIFAHHYDPITYFIWMATCATIGILGIAIDLALTATRPDRVRAFGSILGASEGSEPEPPPEGAPVAVP